MRVTMTVELYGREYEVRRHGEDVLTGAGVPNPGPALDELARAVEEVKAAIIRSLDAQGLEKELRRLGWTPPIASSPIGHAP
jgi:hypothetical protein